VETTSSPRPRGRQGGGRERILDVAMLLARASREVGADVR